MFSKDIIKRCLFPHSTEYICSVYYNCLKHALVIVHFVGRLPTMLSRDAQNQNTTSHCSAAVLMQGIVVKNFITITPTYLIDLF